MNLLNGAKPWDLELDLNDVEQLEVTSYNFEFATELWDGDPYVVSVWRDPWGQHCRVEQGEAGIIDGEDVSDVVVGCEDHCYAANAAVPAPADYAAASANCYFPVLVANQDGTVADPSNNLLWTQDVIYVGCIGAKYYAGAYYACNQLVLGGREDWRVPDIAQLRTLIPGCGTGGGIMNDCDGLFWSDSMPPWLSCCPAGFGCGRCHWIGAFGSRAGTLDYGSVEWRDVSKWCSAKTRCVTDLFED